MFPEKLQGPNTPSSIIFKFAMNVIFLVAKHLKYQLQEAGDFSI